MLRRGDAHRSLSVESVLVVFVVRSQSGGAVGVRAACATARGREFFSASAGNPKRSAFDAVAVAAPSFAVDASTASTSRESSCVHPGRARPRRSSVEPLTQPYAV